MRSTVLSLPLQLGFPDLGLETRQEVLASLNVLVRDWMKSVGLSRRMHWHTLDNIGGRIVTYGSYMLGISQQGPML
jgi:poly(A) polymerase